ncbi:arginine--tRNA ligase [bacterium]|nr:arginine--tRNA ligase [bacterium]
MNLFAEIEADVRAALVALQEQGKLADGLDISRLTVEPPRDPAHGDMATNAAMVLAKSAGMNPRDLAALLVAELLKSDRIEAAEIAGPGFVNLRLDKSVWHQLVPHILTAGLAYGDGTGGAKVNVEYVSANPTGPMHVGNARGAVVGDVLARLLEKTGSDVLREYYINDAGSQVDVLARSALLRIREAQGEDIGAIPEGLYPGDYLVPVGQKLAAMELPDAPDAQLQVAKSVALPMMMDMIRDDLAVLGVKHDYFLSEQSLHDDGSVDKALDELSSKGLIYQGVLEPPKGKEPPPDWEPSPQTLFKSTDFGDDSDRALKKSDGSWTYFAPDIACHFNKYQRGYAQMIDVWGADHIGYIKRMQSAVTAITNGAAQLEVKVCNLVKLMRGGEPVKMSKRSGSFITLREVVEEVGKDAVRFMMLTRKNDAPLDFDFDVVKEQSRDNPVFYVQYAHARIFSVLRNAKEQGVAVKDATLAAAPLTTLTHDAELMLIRLLGTYPRMLLAAAQAREPHRVAFYLLELAAAFHALWNLGKEEVNLRFIQEEDEAGTLARLALIRATAITLASGFDVIGVTPQDELR